MGPNLSLAQRERKHRENFRLGVYASLAALTLLLSGLLIQGCRNSQVPSEDAIASADPATNTASPAATTPALAPAPSETNAAAAAPAAPAPAPDPTPAVAPAPAAPQVAETAPTSAGPAGTYTIKSGDTLGKIAKAHGLSIKALKAANHLKSDRIVAGEKLKLPAPAQT